MKRLPKRSLFIGLGGYLILVLLVLYVFVVGKISVRQLGIDYATLFIFGVIALTIILQRIRSQSSIDAVAPTASADTKQRESIRRSARRYIIAILAMCGLLIYGIWDSNGYPLWITLVGASINIGIICVLSIVVRNKMRLANHGNVYRPK